jgi:hypothetical protein
LDGNGKEKPDTITKYCHVAKKYQHDKQYGEIDIVENWQLIISSEHPDFKWKFVSFNEILFEGEFDFKLGSKFNFKTSKALFSCYVDKNKCEKNEAALFNKQYEKPEELEEN